MYVCTHVRMYACTHERMCVGTCVGLYVVMLTLLFGSCMTLLPATRIHRLALASWLAGAVICVRRSYVCPKAAPATYVMECYVMM